MTGIHLPDRISRHSLPNLKLFKSILRLMDRKPNPEKGNMTDTELIEKFLAGDITAFNRLVWQWQEPIYNFILRLHGDAEISKDICQKTFIRVYKNLRKLKDHHKFKSWLYQIAANLCRDELRRWKKYHLISVDQINAAYEAGEASLPEYLRTTPRHAPDFNSGQQQARTLIELALRKIPEEQRIVIIMKEYQDLKFTEIAEILDQSVSTVKSRLYYGLNALRKIFEQWEIKQEAFEYDL